MKRINVLLLVFVICVGLVACAGESSTDPTVSFFPTEPSEPTEDLGKLVILYTGGLENAFARDAELGSIGYASLVAYQDKLEHEGYQVVLVDGGVSVGGEGAAIVEDGDRMWEIVDASGYDIRVPGTLELSEGVQALRDRVDSMTHGTYISCNLMDQAAGETVFEPYVIVESGDLKIGFVGITAPAAEKYLHIGNDSYSLCQEDKQTLYDTVQQAIDGAADAGADYVIGVGNLGTDPADSPWTSAEIIANTTGLAAFLDCGSGAVFEGSIVVDKDDFEIPVCAPGSEFYYVGQVTLDLNDGTVSAALLDELEGEDADIRDMAEELTSDMEAATVPVEETAAATEENTEG